MARWGCPSSERVCQARGDEEEGSGDPPAPHLLLHPLPSGGRQSVGAAASALQTRKGRALFPRRTLACKSRFLFAIKEIKGDTRKQFKKIK